MWTNQKQPVCTGNNLVAVPLRKIDNSLFTDSQGFLVIQNGVHRSRKPV